MDSMGLLPPSSQCYRAFDVVGLAASLGGIGALSHIIAAIPADFPATIVVVQHLSSRFPSHLVEVLQRRSKLPVQWVEPGDRIGRGCVFVARPTHDVAIGPAGVFTLCNGPKAQFARPSADRLFISMSRIYGARSIGVVLTGTMWDGAMGTRAIKQRGGRVLAQDASTAAAFGMPSAAIATGCVDFVLPLEMIPHALVALVMAPGAAAFLSVPERPARTVSD